VRVLFCDDSTGRAALHVLLLEGELRENNAWWKSRRTYHIAGTDAADVGDLS
jgi:hypothetical protein